MKNILAKIKPNINCNIGFLAGLCIFAGGLNLSVSITEIGLAVAFVCWIFNFHRKEKTSLKNIPLVKHWAIYIAAAILTSTFAIDTTRAFAYFPSDLIKAGACIFLLLSVTRKTAKFMIVSYIMGASAASLWGIVQVLWGYFSEPHILMRAGGTMNAVTYGELITFGFLLAVVLFIETPKDKKIKKLFLIQVFLFGLALILSQSRGALLGAATAMILLWVMERRTRKFLAMLALSGIFIMVIFAFGDHNFSDRFFSIPKTVHRKIFFKTPSPKAQKIDQSSSNRLEQWKTGLEIVKDYPFLGVGPSGIKRVFHAYYPYPIDEQFGWSNLHNLYLHQAAERGILGFAALIYLFAGIFVLAWKINRKNRNIYSIWCLCVLPGFFVMNLTETSFQHSVVSMSIFLMLALSYSSIKE